MFTEYERWYALHLVNGCKKSLILRSFTSFAENDKVANIELLSIAQAVSV